MLKKIAGLARVVAILLAIIAAFPVLGALDTALVLFVLGLIAGLGYDEDNITRMFLVILVLPFVAAGLNTIPQVGAQLGTIASNIQMAASGAAATVIVLRLFNLAKGDLTGLAGS